jgi:hypothetical protein
MPVPSNLGAKCLERVRVGRNAVVRYVPAHYRVEPSPLLRDGLVPTLLHFALQLVQLRRHPLPLGLPSQEKSSSSRASAYVRQPEKVERLRLAREAAFPSPWEGEFPKGDETRLGWVQLISRFPVGRRRTRKTYGSFAPGRSRKDRSPLRLALSQARDRRRGASVFRLSQGCFPNDARWSIDPLDVGCSRRITVQFSARAVRAVQRGG